MLELPFLLKLVLLHEDFLVELGLDLDLSQVLLLIFSPKVLVFQSFESFKGEFMFVFFKFQGGLIGF